MAIGNEGSVLRPLRTLFNVGAIGDLTDGQLLERFATDRGEASELAFAALVERHGPMVERVCRAVLADPHDVQDAFQAAFLVLVKKARGLWVRDSLGPWLHHVAYRTASYARSTALRRRRHERNAAAQPRPASARVDDEAVRVLHDEIHRLPEHYRALVVLCDLEGHTHEQAARQLGRPIGTIKSRLSRARARLRARLLKRGFGPDACALAVAMRPPGRSAAISEGVADATARAAVQWMTARTLISASIASLANGVSSAMFLSRWLKVASVLLVVGAATFGTGALAQKPMAPAASEADGNAQVAGAQDTPYYEAKLGKIRVAVVERGNLESFDTNDVINRVEGSRRILNIVPEGTRVKKGQRVCELDSSELTGQLPTQEIARKAAQAAYQGVRLEREFAEIARTEYIEGIYKRDRAALQGEIAVAKSALQKAQVRRDRTKRVQERLHDAPAGKGDATTRVEILSELDMEDRLDAAEQSLLREKIRLELAETELQLLERYTRDKRMRKLAEAIERARSLEEAKKAAWDEEVSKEKRLRTQIANCKLTAPADGIVVYANTARLQGFPNRPEIEEGATVRERQLIFRIPDLTKMRVNAKVREALIDKVMPGQEARIRVDAYPTESLTGRVEQVSPRPDPTTVFNPDVKLYTTLVAIDRAGAPPGLRPGMTAQVEILITERDNVVTVPIEAVFTFDGEYHVAVRKPDGRSELREVTLGACELPKRRGATERGLLIEVKQGLKIGERVSLTPQALMSGAANREKLPQRPGGAGLQKR